MENRRERLLPLYCFMVSLLTLTVTAARERYFTKVKSVAQQPQYNAKLHSDLFELYHKDVTPSHDQSVTVELGLALISFDFIDEANDMASAHAWLKMAWSDPRLAWDPNDYDNITVIRVNTDVLWIPDIELYNGISVTKLFKHKILLYNSGYLYSLPSYRIDFKCRMDLRYFPYDEQHCRLKYGSWAHDTSLINLTLMGGNKIDLADFQSSLVDFAVVKTTATRNMISYPCCPNEYYADVVFELDLKRSSRAYSAKLIIPSVLTGFLILATFLLPPASQEKITLCGIIFLALLLLLVYLQSIVPASGDTILGEYLAFALFIDFFATILAVVSYNMHARRSQQPAKTMVGGDDQDLNIQMNTGSKRDWLRYLDLVSFAIFSVVFIVGMAIMMGRRG